MSALERLRSRINQVMQEKKPEDTAYDSAQDTTGGHTETGHSMDVTDQGTWMSQIMATGNKVEDWLEFTNHMKEKLDYKYNETHNCYMASLYARAVKTINPDVNKDSPVYALLLVNFAKFKSSSSVEDARGVLHYGRNTVKRVAVVHIASAELEVSEGNRVKAGRILEKARRLRAEPDLLLTKAETNLANGKHHLITEHDYTVYMDSCLGKENSISSSIAVDISKQKSPLRDSSHPHQTAPLTKPLGSLHNIPRVRLSRMSESSEDMTEDHTDCPELFKKPVQPCVPSPAHHPRNDLAKPTRDENSANDTVTFNKKPLRVPRTEHMSDDGDTVPISLDTDKGIYKRSIKSYHSTPDIKGSLSLGRKLDHTEEAVAATPLDKERRPSGKTLKSYHSTPDFKAPTILSAHRKPRNLGKPMRVKRPSFPEFTDGTTDTSEDPNSDIFKLEPLPETDGDQGRESVRESSHSQYASHSEDRHQEKKPEPQLQSNSLDMDFKELEQWFLEHKKTFANNELSKIQNDVVSESGHVQDTGQQKGAEPNHHRAELQRVEEGMEQGSPVKADKYSHTAERTAGDCRKDLADQQSADNEHSKDSGFSTQPLDPAPASCAEVSVERPGLDQSCSATASTIVASGNNNTKSTITTTATQQVSVPKPSLPLPNFGVSVPMTNHVETNPVQKPMTVPHGLSHIGVPPTPGMVQPINIHQQGLGQPNLQQAGMTQPGFGYIPTPSRQTQIVTINNQVYTILQVMGRGGSSKVYETLDPNLKLRAVKCVNLDNADLSTINSYKNEIKLLERLQHSDKIIRMYDYEYHEETNMLYVVMERGDTDLASHFKVKAKQGGINSVMQKFYWMEMLKAVQILHKEGIVHSDLKPANFVLVAGNLKLIDFGIANVIQQDMTSVTRDTQVGTINYMSPEAIQDTCGGTQVDENGRIKPRIKIGVKSDVWSLGCILYNLVYGRPPFSKIANNILRLQAITDPRYQIEFPESADTTLRKVLMKCLRRIPKERPSIEELLEINY